MKYILSGGGVDSSLFAYKMYMRKVEKTKILFIPFAEEENKYYESFQEFKKKIYFSLIIEDHLALGH